MSGIDPLRKDTLPFRELLVAGREIIGSRHHTIGNKTMELLERVVRETGSTWTDRPTIKGIVDLYPDFESVPSMVLGKKYGDGLQRYKTLGELLASDPSQLSDALQQKKLNGAIGAARRLQVRHEAEKAKRSSPQTS